MQNSKTKTVVIDFSKDKQRALRILADEKKIRDEIRRKKDEDVELPQYIKKDTITPLPNNLNNQAA